MDLSLSQVRDYINYYAIHKNWKELELLLCTSEHRDNELCIFWNAICLLKGGDVIESRALLEQLRSNCDYNLASICALVETYLMTQNDDEEYDAYASQIAKLKSSIKELSKTDNIERLIAVSTYFWHIGRLKQARYYVEKALNFNKEKVHSLAIAGWIYLSETSSKYRKKAASHFASALSIAGCAQQVKEKEKEKCNYSLLAIYGLARCYQLKGKLRKAHDCMTQLIVDNQWFMDGLSMKSELNLLIGHHQECIDTVNRLLNTPNYCHNIQCLVIKLCYFLMFNGNYTSILNQLKCLYTILIEEYSVNKYASYSVLLYNISNITSLFVMHSTEILEMSLQFISIAVDMSPENAQYLTLQGNLYLYLGYTETALRILRDAASFDVYNVEALCGAVYCRVLLGDFVIAHQELQFIIETTIASGNGKDKFIHLLQAIIVWKTERNEDEFNLYIGAALDEYRKNIESHRFSSFVDLSTHNPRFCIMIANEYLKHCPSSPAPACCMDPRSNYLTETVSILGDLCSRIPGMMDAHLLYAKCKYLSRDMHGTECILQSLKSMDANYWRTHLLQSQVALFAESYNESQQCLDVVIGLNFEIQSTLIYHMMKSKLLWASGAHTSAIEVLENVVNKIYSFMANQNVKKGVLFSKYEEEMDEEEFVNLCISIVIELAQMYKIENEMNKAKELMRKARAQFTGENEMMLIRLAEVRILLKQNEIDAALSSLHCIPSSSAYYRRSRLLIADIYLKNKQNKQMYIACFEELINENPHDIDCQLLLGDALMNIQRTSDAMHCYEKALILSDYDEKLALKFGRALITTHDYQRAIVHFEAIMANNDEECGVDLKRELAELYLQFEEYDKAQSILRESLSQNSDTFHDLESNIEMLCLFADLYQNVERWNDAQSLLTQAWNAQQKLMSIGNTSGKDMKAIESNAANICYNLGFDYLRLNNVSGAEEYLTKAIEYDIEHQQAIIELAKLYEMKGNYESAKDKLKSVLSINPNNEKAIMLLVNLCIDDKDLKSAITELRLFRGSNDCNALNINILLELMKLLKRSGEYDEIKDLMKERENLNTNSRISVGMHYIRGYVLWHIDNDSKSAINQLNQIRNDINWGPRALMLMIKIYFYINAGFTFIDIMQRYSHDSRHEQLQLCQVLVKELKYFKPGHDATLLTIGCLLLMASRNDDALDKAYQTLNIICNKNAKHILSHFAFACCLYLKELQNKAIEFLNKFIFDNKNHLLFEGHLYFDEYQELLLILLQLQQSRDSIAKEEIEKNQKICLQILNNDASCSKAWEIVASIEEKQDNFALAAKHYGTAWNLQNKNNALLGYYYARSLFKIAQYMQCIDVAHKVLDQDPDFIQMNTIIDLALTKIRL